MKAKITAIRHEGKLSDERLVIKVETACNIGEFLVLHTGYRGDSVTTRIVDTFWFPDKEVDAGDLVVLYTKTGTNSEKKDEKNKSHFFYWGKSSPVWNMESTAAVLVYGPTWASFVASKPTS